MRPRITGHQVLHVDGFLAFTLSPKTDGGAREEHCADERPTHADPSQDIGPVIGREAVFFEDLPGRQGVRAQARVVSW